MRIAINGTGIAGPTLAWWLQRYGYEPVLFEKSPRLRTGGYVIDFWGVGYDVAEKMGLLPALYEKGYVMESLRMVNRHGRKKAAVDVDVLRSLTNNRYMSIARGDFASTILQHCQRINPRFGVSVVEIEQGPDNVTVQLSDGSEETFEIVVGADGLHSHIRTLSFGPQTEFERSTGYYVAAFHLRGYQPRDELVYVSYTVPKRQVARISLRGDSTVFLFVWRAELVNREPKTEMEEKGVLCDIFGDMQWEVPRILDQMDEAKDVYFDRVSQIHMDHWTNGRVALVGDAAACASLLAGEGAGLAMTEAYVLAGELHRAAGNHTTAFQNYENKLIPFLKDKQQSALSFAGFFAPKNRSGLLLRDVATNLCNIPFLAKLLVGRTLHDTFSLPDYCST